MSGHFEKGKWIEDIHTIVDLGFTPLYVDFDSKFPCSEQVDRVAKLLNLKSLTRDQCFGEMIITGTSGNRYRILDFFEYLLRRMQ